MFASKYSQTMAVLPEQVANGAKHSCKKIKDRVSEIDNVGMLPLHLIHRLMDLLSKTIYTLRPYVAKKLHF